MTTNLPRARSLGPATFDEYLAGELIPWMTPANQEDVARYRDAMVGVEDCLDDLTIDEAGPALLWRPLNRWFVALDTLHSTAVWTGDDILDAFHAYETGRYMAKRRDVVEAIAAHYSPHLDDGAWDTGYYSDPQAWIDGRGSTAVCFSNGVVDYEDAAGRALRARKEAERRSAQAEGSEA